MLYNSAIRNFESWCLHLFKVLLYGTMCNLSSFNVAIKSKNASSPCFSTYVIIFSIVVPMSGNRHKIVFTLFVCFLHRKFCSSYQIIHHTAGILNSSWINIVTLGDYQTIYLACLMPFCIVLIRFTKNYHFFFSEAIMSNSSTL